MKKLLFATSIVALSTAAHAGITCNLTDERGNALQYSFARGGHGFTNEIAVTRNGAILSNGGPMWSRAYNSASRTVVLEQGGWRLVYEAKPNDTDVSPATLFAPTTAPKAAGTCVVDYSLDALAPVAPTIVVAPAPAPDNSRLDDIERKLNDLANRPAPAAAPIIVNAPAAPAPAPVIINNAAPAPAPAAPPIIINAPAPAPAAPTLPATAPTTAAPASDTPAKAPIAHAAVDSVPLVTDGARAAVTVTLGAYSVNMLIETGATGVSIGPTLADKLVAAGDAHYEGEMEVTVADGSVHKERILIVHKLSVGNHVLNDVPAGVTPVDTMMLLPFPVLNQMGRFTIDTRNNQLVFG